MLVPGLEDYTSVEKVRRNDLFKPYYRNGMLFIPASEQDYHRISISTLSGQIIFTWDEPQLIRNENKSYVLPDLSKGIYFVNIQSEYNQYTSKILVR
jgi:hypothetical protein